MPVVASTITNVCIFFPILFVKGITGVIFSEFAVITIVVMMGSLFSALTLTPMLSSKLLKKAKFGNESSGWFFRLSEKTFLAIEKNYGDLVAWALRHRAMVILTAILIFGGTLFLIPLLGTEYMPEQDSARIQGTLYLPVGTRVEETARVMRTIDQILKEEVPEKERIAIFTRCGGGGGMGGAEGSHVGSFGVRLIPRVERSRNVKEIAAGFRRRINKIQGLFGIEKFRLDTGDPMAGMLLGGERPLTVNIIGNDLDVTDAIAAKIKQIALNTPGTVDINISREKGRPELRVRVDREKASAIGFNVSDVGDMVRAAIYGTEASKYRIHGDEYVIFVRYREKDRSDIKDVLASSLRLPSGEMMRVDNVANVGVEYGPVTIDRKDRGRIVNVMGGVDNRSLGDVVADIEKEIAKLDIPSGVEVIMSGQATEQRESFFWLTLSLIVGIFLVYMIMASQFESLLDPFVVMFSVPFAFTGTIWAIFLGGHHINIVVFLGLLMLVGVVVNNAIVLVDYTNLLRARGLPLFEAVPKACRTRLRPVLMTSLTTIAGLIPMAFGKGQGSEVWNPIGLTVLGGLLVSTFVTLMLVPTVYSILETHVKKTHD
jgi:HAE1 family hydrophobic/amphiphilic exporter-1